MKGPRVRTAGISLLEMVIGIAILLVLTGAAVTALAGAQTAFVQNEIVSQVRMRAQRALERVVQLASKAVSDDSEYYPFEPNTGVGSHGIQFRLIEGTDSTGAPIYDDVKVFIFGPDANPWPNQGLIVGRGATMSDIWTQGAGEDGVLGTTDDNVDAMVTPGQPYVEMLVPSKFAPSQGDMFTVDVSPAPVGRLLTVRLRLNATSSIGDFLLANDLEITERIALRQ